MEQDVKANLRDIANSLRKITYEDCVERPAFVMVDAKYAAEVFDELIDALEDYEFENESKQKRIQRLIAELENKQLVRHGHWTHQYYPTVWYGPGEPPEWVCSECEGRAYNIYDWCPECGAKMDGEQ